MEAKLVTIKPLNDLEEPFKPILQLASAISLRVNTIHIQTQWECVGPKNK